jgi:DNA-binding CsgD family transcriptional regulator
MPASITNSGVDTVTQVDELLGRDAQLHALTAALGDAAGPARSMVLEGEAGIGKTALFRAAVHEARRLGYRVLEASPVEAEAGLALAGLDDLIGDALPEMLPALPAPQRAALEVALLLRPDEGRPPDQRALGLALLHGIQAMAAQASVLVAIDDAHWLDGSSAALLRFALRRLRGEPVVVLLARRTAEHGQAAPTGLGASGLPAPELITLGPLSLGAIHGMVIERLEMALARPVLLRLHELSRGNPFYALELARGVRDGSLRLEHGEALPPDIEALVGARFTRLPRRSRITLGMAAAASRPTIGLLEAAEPGCDVRAALAPAARAGIVRLGDDDVLFSHPLLASGALAALDVADRRACHARLAAVVEEPVDRARHLALATAAPDAGVATEVEEAAALTRARGAASGAVELIALAIRLTEPDDPARERRLLLEADYRFEAGDAPAASSILEGLVAATSPGPERALMLARLARYRQLAADTGSGMGLLREALQEAGADDPIRGEAHEALAWALLLVRHDLPQALEHARAAVAIGAELEDRADLAKALATLALVETLLGMPDSGAMAQALALEPATLGLQVLRQPSFANGYRLACIDELEAADRAYAMLLRRAEDQGDESAPGHILSRRAVVHLHLGDLAGAERLASEAIELSGQTGQLPTEASGIGRLALVLARQGELDRAATLAAQALALASAGAPTLEGPAPVGEWALHPHARGGEYALWAMGHVALCRERADEAADALATLSEPVLACGVREPGELRWLSDEVEALVLAGRTAEAERRVALLEAMAESSGRASALVAARAARGLREAAAGRLERALSHLEAAAAHSTEAPLPFERARTLLLLGRVQRRLAHKRDARATLELALEAFGSMGARHWAETCRAELGRIGGRSAAGSELTGSEQRVIELVAQGLSNKEVASALFVSPKAVEVSLSRIYAKLGVRSRTELARHGSASSRPDEVKPAPRAEGGPLRGGLDRSIVIENERR